MNKTNKSEFNIKLKRITDFFEKTGYEAMVIGRQDNFSWLTNGGDNSLIITSDYGCALLVITKGQSYLVAAKMDGQRIIDEEIAGFDIEPVIIKWYEPGLSVKVAEIIKGKRTISDISVDGADVNVAEIYDLHYPLTDIEISSLKENCKKSEEIFVNVLESVKPGVSEIDIKASLEYEYSKANMICDVILIGADDRISKYRHPIPTYRKINKLAMIHTAVKNKGLHAIITRMVYFGDKLPEDIARKFDVLCQIESASISMCSAGQKFSNILATQKQIYKNNGFGKEWEEHFIGGVTGYMIADPGRCLNTDLRVVNRQAYNWFVTITGTKVEETTINIGDRREILTSTGLWPTKKYTFNGQNFKLPQILLK